METSTKARRPSTGPAARATRASTGASSSASRRPASTAGRSAPPPARGDAHVRYFPTAAAAADAGFRPCLRCRPEAAPGTPAWLGTSAVVRRALALVHEGALDEGSVDALAARLGIGPRQLHRLFVAHVGAPPLAVAQTRRLHFAKRLIDETDFPMTQIAFASGFSSLRRFNDAFQRTYDRPPSALRRLRHADAAPARGEVTLRLAFRPPGGFDDTLAFLGARAIPGVERVDAHGYARTVALPTGPATVAVSAVRGRNELSLRVVGAPATALLPLTTRARRVFDLASDPATIGAALRGDPLLGPLVRRRPGLRIPGAWDAFECAVRAVVGQQVSVAAGRTLATRLVERVGTRLARPMDGLTHLFPSPAALAAADLTGLGLVPARARTLAALARAVADGRLVLRRAGRRSPRRARRAARRRRVDGRVRRPARPRGAGRLPRRRPRAAARRRRRTRPHRPRPRRAGRSLAAVAWLRRRPPLGGRRLPAPVAPRLAPPRKEIDDALRRDRFAGRAAAGRGRRGRSAAHPLPGRARPAEARPVVGARPQAFPRPRDAARRVLPPRAADVRPAARPARHAVPARDLARALDDPVRRDDLVRGAGRDGSAGPPPRARSGGERSEPAPDRRPLPPGHRQGRLAHRLRRRAADEARPPRAGGRNLRRAVRSAPADLEFSPPARASRTCPR